MKNRTPASLRSEEASNPISTRIDRDASRPRAVEPRVVGFLKSGDRERKQESDLSTEVEPPLFFEKARTGIPGYYGYLPIGGEDSESVPLVLCIHGISRDSREQVELLLPEAEARGYALLAPQFDEAGFGDYQRLGRRGRGPRADLALIECFRQLEAVAGRPFGQVYLMGFSGGAQFAHRFVMAHPDRIAAAVCASSGWYTLPDARKRYPRGLRADGDLAGVRFDPMKFLRVPILVSVGSEDVERDFSLRRQPRLDASQGHNRVERAQSWHRAMADAAKERGLVSRTRYIELPGVAHSFRACVDAELSRIAFEFFEETERGL